MMASARVADRWNSRISRRGAITLGASGLAGITWLDLLRADEPASGDALKRSIINVHLDGGPPQHETIDPKPEAPAEIRGEFRPISTSMAGVCVSELMPQMATLVHRVALIRSLVGSAGAHDAFQCQSGFPASDLKAIGGRPALGCVVNKLRGTPSDQVPSFIDLMQGRALVRDSARPGFLGPSYSRSDPTCRRCSRDSSSPGWSKSSQPAARTMRSN